MIESKRGAPLSATPTGAGRPPVPAQRQRTGRNGTLREEAAPRSNGGAQPPTDLVGHVALALSRHVRDLRRDRFPVPADLEELTAFVISFVKSRLDTTPLAGHAPASQNHHVAGRLLLTRREAAEQLGVSERTIDRLVAAGRLPVVHLGRAARVRAGDLRAYVLNLGQRPGARSRPDGVRGRQAATRRPTRERRAPTTTEG